MAVADVYDALISERPYKRPWPAEEALAEIRAQAGRHFAPLVVTALEELLLQGGRPQLFGTSGTESCSS